MPFPMVYGLPKKTPKWKLRQLRQNIIDTVAQTMQVPANIVRPFFVPDLLGDPDKGQDDTICVLVGTGMFAGKADAAAQKKIVTSSIAHLVWSAFEGKYEVEAFVNSLDPEGKTLLNKRQPLK